MITVDKKDLFNALKECKKTVNTKSRLPVLNNVLLKITSCSHLQVVTTNLENFTEMYISYIGDHGDNLAADFAITVPFKILYNQVMVLDSGKINLRMDKMSKLEMCQDKFKCTLNGLDADEFPSLDYIKKQLKG